MNADWYVEFSLRNPASGKMERKRIYDGFKLLNTYEQRMKHAEKLIAEYTEMIKSGEISAQKMVEFEDQLLFDTRVYKSRKKLGIENTFRVLASGFITYRGIELSEKTLQNYKSKLRAFDDFLKSKKLHEKSIQGVENEKIVEFLRNLVLEGG